MNIVGYDDKNSFLSAMNFHRFRMLQFLSDFNGKATFVGYLIANSFF